MKHLTLGLGIVISAYVLKPLYLAFLFREGSVINPELLFRQHLGELSLFVGLVCAWLIVRHHSNTRFSHVQPATWILRLGVWASLAISFLYWCTFVPGLAYLFFPLSRLGVMQVLGVRWPSIVANALVFGGVLWVLLAAARSKEREA
jgi:hypothetical protein